MSEKLKIIINFFDGITKVLTAIALITGALLFSLFYFWPDCGRELKRSLNTDRHWFYMGKYNKKYNRRTEICSDEDTSNDMVIEPFEKQRFENKVECFAVLIKEDGTLKPGQALMADRNIIAGRVKAGHTQAISTSIAKGQCVYVLESIITDNTQKTVWFKGIVGC